MNSFIKKLKEMSSGKPTAADIDGEKYENNTYAIKSLYPDRETKERIERIIRQKICESERE